MGKKNKKNGATNKTANSSSSSSSSSPSSNVAQFTVEERRKPGPIKNRSCTDLLCLLLFVVFIGLWSYLILFFLNYVDVQQTIYPSDSYGNICGKGNLKDKPYLAFFNLFKCVTEFESTIVDGCRTPQVCVSECPNVTFSVKKDASLELRNQELEHVICWYNITPDANNLYEYVQNGECAKFYFRSEPLGGRCVPSVLTMIGDKVKDELSNQPLIMGNQTVSRQLIEEKNEALAVLMNAINLGNKIANDLVKTWRWILIGLVMAMVVAFLWIFLMQWVARYMIWLSITAIFMLNIVGLYYSATKYQELANPAKDVNTNQTLARAFFLQYNMADEEYLPDAYKYIRASSEGPDMLDFHFKEALQDQLDSYMKSSTTWMVLCIVLGTTLAIITLLMFCLCRRISLAIAVIEEASKAVNCMKSTLFFPIVPYILKLAVLALWFVAVVIISSGSHPQYRDRDGNRCIPQFLDKTHYQDLHPNVPNHESPVFKNEPDPNCTRHQPFTRKFIYGAHAFNLFGIIWVMFFLLGMCYVTLSGAFASYYWTFKKEDVPFFALLESFFRCVRYHLGSIALGSLVVTIVRFIRIVLEYIDNKCKKYANFFVVRIILCCCKCCFWCLENFIKFINKNAYIMMAIHGKNFCTSAKNAFFLLADNGIRAVVLNCLSGFLLFLSKVAVTGLVGVAGFYVLTNRVQFLVTFEDLNYYWAPLGLFVILSYVVTSTFFNVYDVAVETIFLCYLEDCKINDGTKERPYYMHKRLAKVFGTKNRT